MPIKIIQGGMITFGVKVLDTQTGDPLDLTGVTALSTCFMKTDGTELMLSLGSGITLLSAVLGKISVHLTAAQSALLAVTVNGTFQLSIVYGTDDPILIQAPEAYQVLQSAC